MGPACERCLRVSKQAFQLLSWEEVVSQARSSPPFKELVGQAISVFEGRQKTFNSESFTSVTRCGYRLSKTFIFIAENETEKQLGVKAKELATKMPMQALTDEHGEPINGFVFAGNGQRKLKVFADVFTDAGEEIFASERQLRAGQGCEVSLLRTHSPLQLQ